MTASAGEAKTTLVKLRLGEAAPSGQVSSRSSAHVEVNLAGLLSLIEEQRSLDLS